MSKAPDNIERVETERKSLVCPTCGAGNRLDRWAVEHGWFRCSHCEAPGPVPGAGDFAVDGPEGKVTRVVRPGSSEFEIERGFLLPLEWGLLGLAITDLLVSGVTWLLARYASESYATHSGMLYWLLALAAVVVVLGYESKQRLAVTEDSLEGWWITLGVRWRHRRLDTRRFKATVRTVRPLGVLLRSPGQSLLVRLGNEVSARWLEREVVAAVKDARLEDAHESVPCPGCGGPVATEREIKDRGGIECEHCGTGLVQTGGGIALPAAQLTHRLKPFVNKRPPPAERDGDAVEWKLKAWAWRHPFLLPLHVGLMVILDVLLVGMAWGITRLPVLKSITILGLVAVALGMARLTAHFCVWCFADMRIRVEPTVFLHESSLFGWRFGRRVVPLARVVRLESRPQEDPDAVLGDHMSADSGLIELHMRTASKKLKSEIFGKELVEVVAEALLAAAESLAALGREVELNARLQSRRDATAAEHRELTAPS